VTKGVSDFQIFIKPVGAECNLRCSYCYYLKKQKIYKGSGHLAMSDETLEKYVIQHIYASADGVINFSWHGGEPLLAGIEFFRRAVMFQKKHKPAGSIVTNGIQTNGTLLNEEWCSFLASENFIAGVSIDGPEELHNKFRTHANGSGTFKKVISGYKMLVDNGIQPEILCVVNSENVKKPHQVYGFLKSLGAKYISFLPLVKHDPQYSSGVTERSVPSREFGVFLSRIFDEWVEKDIGDVKIQIFEEAARTAFNQDHTLCIFKVNCGGVPVLEHNGDFYSCDHFVDKKHLVGNINSGTILEFLASETQSDFGLAKSKTLPLYCRSCEVLSMCNGECPKNRFIYTPDGDPGLNYLCAGYKIFFNHSKPFVDAIAEMWKTQK
jgi:uncharacterized protein